MRTRAVLGSIFGSIAVLVVGWQAGAAAAHHASALAPAPVTTNTPSATQNEQATQNPSATSTPAPTPTSPAKSATTTGSFTGSSVSTRFGNVQVKITVSAGKITDVIALQLTNEGGRSVQISNYAAPILRREVLAAQSAKVNSVGGATYTSDGYLTSLQSALDKAGI